MTTHVVIMAGGVGSRLYPLSTPERPKQFMDILQTGRTLIQMTFDRFLEVDRDAMFWVVTSEKYHHYIKEQLPSIPDDNILLEPEARNTAPCISYASRKILTRYPDAAVIFTPADAYVPDCKSFGETMRKALSFVSEREAIVCTGITPTRPETGYGYIRTTCPGSGDVVRVDSFKEKPVLEVAQSYLDEGGYMWNAGIFVSTASTLCSELRKYAPRIEEVMDAIQPSFFGEAESGTLSAMFPRCDKISIDYAVIEKSSVVHVVAYSGLWSDLGSFKSIEEITGKKFV